MKKFISILIIFALLLPMGQSFAIQEESIAQKSVISEKEEKIELRRDDKTFTEYIENDTQSIINFKTPLLKSGSSGDSEDRDLGNYIPTVASIKKNGKNYSYKRARFTDAVIIQRYCYEDKQLDRVYYESSVTANNAYGLFSEFVLDNVIYVPFYENNNTNTLKVIGFDINSDTEVYNKTFAISSDKYLCEFCIDGNKNFYFLSVHEEDNSYYCIKSYDKDGTYLDTSIGLTLTGFMELSGANADNTVLFLGQLANGRLYSYSVRLNNGKFVDNGINAIAINYGIKWTFLNNEKTIAISDYGYIVNIEYGEKVRLTVNKVLLKNGGIAPIYGLTYDDTYIYLGRNNGKVYIINRNGYKIERTLELGTEKTIDRVCKVGDKVYIEYSISNKYYVTSANISDFASPKQNVEITSHSNLSKTKSEIKEKYEAFKIKNAVTTFVTSPSVNAPYVSGVLTDETKTETLNQINYFRYLAGVNSVPINDKYMEYSGDGAVILEKINELTHYPAMPSDMDEDFYSKGYAGTSCLFPSESASANISMGSTMADSIKGYVDDTNNVEVGSVGHRLSILDYRANSTSFGYAGRYGVVDMFLTWNATCENDFTAWPSVGNFPTNAMDVNAIWSIALANSKYTVENVKIELKANNKTYTVTPTYISSYSAYSFEIPSEVKAYLTDNGNTFKDKKSVEVSLTGMEDEDGNSYIIKYPVNFFSLDNTEEEIKGDTNSDGRITLFDAFEVLKKAIGNETATPAELAVMDMNGDGRITLYDAFEILKMAIAG